MTITTPDTHKTTPRSGAIDQLAIDTIRFLAADMVEEANSGHAGMPMGAAPMAWTLFSRHLAHNPADSAWADRDRFVLSAGHGSALQYALLHLFGYGLPLSELRRFRQLGSATPGHPELGHTDGVETTTGPLGQGLATAVGMALGERMNAARYPEITGHHTYAIVGDGCLMEGVSHEAASLAGHLGLGRLIVLFDDNDITIDGPAGQSCSDDQLMRFAAYGWHVARVDDGTDVDAIDAALTAAKAAERPSFIAIRTVIGHGAPGIEGTSKAHGAPLGATVLRAAKKNAGWGDQRFVVPAEVRERCAELAMAGARQQAAWTRRYDTFEHASPVRCAEWVRAQDRELPEHLEEILDGIETGIDRATRQTSQAVLAAVAAQMPELIGGSADLAGSTGTVTGQDAVSALDFAGSVIHFGIREFAMAAVLNGLSLHGGFRPYGSTFLVFSDYLRPALRLSALMRQPVVYILTHDSVAVGEDGPTHQPVEHIESLRLIPGVRVFRPADDHETIAAWRAALRHTSGPSVLILSRQTLPSLESADGTEPDFLTSTGARVVRQAEQPDIDIIATGSEVHLAVEAAVALHARGLVTRVISAPWRERFAENSGVFGRAPVVMSVEAGTTLGWQGLTGTNAIGIDEFGASGPGDEVLAHFGMSADNIVRRAVAAANAHHSAPHDNDQHPTEGNS
ncbi:transketolase [Aeromicrobium sp.]|uniref:transketolase n=1 Tax=Aeromicrobium sp. TaxID=1871063 RepID=UPI001986576B|nr:transketolase [Aeromicrobium sp.]MBC7633820.1 transketolase [Aeromicrobium sp.]